MTTLAYSNYESLSKDEKKKPPRNKTYKKRRSKKAEQFLNSMPVQTEAPSSSPARRAPSQNTNLYNYQDDGGNSGLDDQDPSSAGFDSPENFTPSQDPATEQFGLLREGLAQQKKYHAEQNQYYNQYIPSYTGTPQNTPYYSQLLNSNDLPSSAPDELMKKLNYVVHLLEEQHDEKSGSVTEELVLYMFLGVFVIFVVDSFSRSGKYKR